MIAAVGATLNAGTALAAATYDDWYSAATAATISPITPSANDLSRTWTGADGRTITARVRQPTVDAKSVILEVPPAGADARPYFEKMVTAALKAKATRLIIPAGTYVFKTTSSASSAHWLVRSLNNATIVGNGAKLVFTKNIAGFAIQDCQKLKVSNLVLDYAFKTSSFGHMIAAPDKIHGILQINDPSSVTSADGIGHITQYDMKVKLPHPADLRVYTTGAKWLGNGQYFSMGFGKNTIGKDYLVYHHYYGGNALKIQGDPHSSKWSEDITLDGVRIIRSPGMGIVVSGVKRGVAIVNSQITPATGEYASSEYDAIHVLPLGGDLIIRGNTIAGAGDDNINLNNPVVEVASVDAAGTTVQAGQWSYFFKPGDTLFAFDDGFKLIGKAKIVSVSSRNPAGQNTVVLDQPIPGLAAGYFLRDADNSNSRVVIENNRMTLGGKALVQVANVLVQGNTFTGSGIRTLSNFSMFKEGMGGLNVVINGNTISGGKMTVRYNYPWAAISVYAVNSKSEISQQLVNRYITITNNTITNVPQACISVASTAFARVTGNTCTGTNKLTPGGYALNLLNDVNVALASNTLDDSAAKLLTFNSLQVH